MENFYFQKIGTFIFFCSLFLFSFTGFAQVGINTTTPTTMLDVNGALSLREGPAIGTSSINSGLITLPGATPYSLYRIVGQTADFSIDGIIRVTGADGHLLTLINTTTHAMTIKSNNSPAAVNRIVCPSNADLKLIGANSSVTLQYNKPLNKWVITGYSDVGGYGRNTYSKIGTSNTNTNSATYGDMADMSITFTPKHSVVYVNFSASGTMDKGINFDTNAYANFQIMKDISPIAGTTTLASAGTSNGNFFYISNFPFVETFEDSSPTLASWYLKEYELFTEPWKLRNGSSGVINNAHGGVQNLYFEGEGALGIYETTKVISPVMDLSVLTDPKLTFWFGQPRKGFLFPVNNALKIYYRTSYSGDWFQIPPTRNNAINSWTQVTYNLPNPSSSYQIAFEGIGKSGHASVIDDVTISGTGGGVTANLDTAWNAGFNMYPITVTPGEETTIKVQWLRDGKLPRQLRNYVAADGDRSHRNLTIID